MLVLIVPVNLLSLRSSCSRFDNRYSVSGSAPVNALKFKSTWISLPLKPISEGIEPEISPSSSKRYLRSINLLISDGKDPAMPFRSKSILSIKPDSEQAAPPQSHSLDGVSHASLLSLPGTIMSQLAFASAIDSSLEKSGGALHSNQSSPSVL